MENNQTPSRSGALALFSAAGVAYFGLVMLALSLFWAGYNPISEPASDYGVGRFALEMNLGFFIAGASFIAFALNYSKQKLRSKAGSILMFIAGAVLIMDSVFTTNLPNAPATLHGTIHGFGGLLFFTTAPIGLLLMSRHNRAQFLVTLASFIVGFVVLGAPINAGGLGERLILLVIFSSVIFWSLRIFRKSPNKIESKEDRTKSET